MPTLLGSRDALVDITGLANQRMVVPIPPEQSDDVLKAGTKRKADDAPSDVDDEDIHLHASDIDANCDQVRRKIRTFLDSGEMKKVDFVSAIAVSATSLNNFLSKNGRMEGSGSDAYFAAWSWFKARDIAGIKPAKKQKATTAKAQAQASPDLSGISLRGEATDDVPVYDSCDEIRKKINSYMAKTGTGVSQAQFCRDLAAQVHCETKKISSKQLTDFRSKKGPNAGNTSIVFYTAYIFFEKLRLAEGKEKSKHRLAMEDAHPDGFDITRPYNRGFLCARGTRPYVDKLGRIEFA